MIDYAVDATWRPARLRIQTQEHRLVLVADAGRLVGERDGEPLEIPYREDLGYRSPVFNAVTANRLGRSGDVEALSLETETLRDRPERQRYELQGPERVATPVGAFEATVWRYTALETGWTARLCVAGDVVVAFEGAYELISYEPGPRGPFPS
ncbi:MAG TPA: hypothetical protein VM638_08630 [Actinomycetota bacterium]|nr:hypothetical protein [Actinomycetota bacterium]